MHSTLVRVQNAFGFFTTVAFTVAAVVALSSFVSLQKPSASIRLRNVQIVMGRPHYYSYKKEEYAHIKFDLDTGRKGPIVVYGALSSLCVNMLIDHYTDLHTLFNWNTKQVFLYLKAVYPPTRAGQRSSEAIIWDAIIASDSAPWHQNYYIHPDSNSKLPKMSKKAAAAAKRRPSSPYPVGELHLQNQRPKYQITDISSSLSNRTDVILELGWNVQPWVGALTWVNFKTYGAWKGLQGGKSEAFDFPNVGAKAIRKKDLETQKGGEGYRLEADGEQPRRQMV